MLTTFLFAVVVCGPAQASAPDRPNVLILLADDMGFSDAGCYGGEIRTPNIDRLARNGLRFIQGYNTARCWPSRSALLSGYYPQQIRMDPPKGRLPGWAKLLPHYLKPQGYCCYHSGKWHVNGAPKVLADGEFDRSYKLDDHDRHFGPKAHMEDDRPLPPVREGESYYTATAIADHAIRYLKDHAETSPDRPFFAYVAFTTPHFPLQAPAEDIARYRGRYDVGWDVIRGRRMARLREMGIVSCDLPPLEPDIVPRWNLSPEELRQRVGPGEAARAVPWSSLTGEQRAFQAEKMAIHAAMIDRMDQEIGRVLAQIEAMGALENTLVLFASDNGASAEQIIRGDGHDPSLPPGSAGTFLGLGPGWSTSSNTPFRMHKSWVHEGGISTPWIVSWPKGIAARGEIRTTPVHLLDIAPTLIELTGASTPDLGGPPLPGRSLLPTFAEDRPIERDFLYFNHDGHHALRVGDWKLVTMAETDHTPELYNLAEDRGERANLAETYPERVREMLARWRELESRFRGEAEEGSDG
jgi:arylsulfatase A-like enzyme